MAQRKVDANLSSMTNGPISKLQSSCSAMMRHRKRTPLQPRGRTQVMAKQERPRADPAQWCPLLLRLYPLELHQQQ